MTTITEQPTVEERWPEYQMLLEVFRMFSWGGLEAYVERPLYPGEPGTVWLQATALPPEEMDKPAAERRTVVTTIPINVYEGPPSIIAKQRQQQESVPVA